MSAEKREFAAHIRLNEEGERDVQSIEEHNRAVGEMASEFGIMPAGRTAARVWMREYRWRRLLKPCPILADAVPFQIEQRKKSLNVLQLNWLTGKWRIKETGSAHCEDNR